MTAAPIMNSAAITVDNVTVHYGEVLALDGATISIQPGRVCGLVGMNGSGKSTLFKTIMGMVRPDSGTASINGGTPAQARKLGVVGYGQLSGGQKKRAFVARGIAQGASVLLLDEPFAGVDKRSEATITRLLRELAAEGATALVSTHDLHALPGLADEAILLMRRVLMHGDPAEILRPDNLALAFGLDVLNRSDHA